MGGKLSAIIPPHFMVHCGHTLDGAVKGLPDQSPKYALMMANPSPGNLCQRRTFFSGPSVAFSHQYRGSHCHPQFHRSEYCLLYPPALESSVHNK